MARCVDSDLTIFAAEGMQQQNRGRDNEEEEEVLVEKNETEEFSSGGDVTGSSFQMPRHYPRYNKKDYEAMSESKLDRLLAAYGLFTEGDLNYKRGFAMGAFLWPDFRGQQLAPSPSLHSIRDCSVVEFLCGLLGFDY